MTVAGGNEPRHSLGEAMPARGASWPWPSYNDLDTRCIMCLHVAKVAERAPVRCALEGVAAEGRCLCFGGGWLRGVLFVSMRAKQGREVLAARLPIQNSKLCISRTLNAKEP